MTFQIKALLPLAFVAAFVVAAGEGRAQSSRAQEARKRYEEQRAARKQAAEQPAPPDTKPAPAGTYKPDQKVEVREGDQWSGATFVKQEGRKYQIKYDDGTEEWVTSDRLRLVGGDAAAPAADGKPGATTQKAPKETFANGSKVEAKEALSWKPATIKNQEGDLYLVVFDGWESQTWWQWLHVTCIRKIGSNKEGPHWARGVSVSSKGVAKAKEEAKVQFANADAELAAEKKGEKKDPFAPAAYDKPVTPSKRDAIEDFLPAGGPKSLAQFDPVSDKPKIAERGYVLRGVESPWAPANMLFAGPRGVMVYANGNARDKTGKIEILDLAGGRNLAMVDFDPLSSPIAVAPSGNRIAGRAYGFFPNTKNRLDVFELKGTAPPKHLISFEPYAGEKTRDIAWAGFLDDDHILTCSTSGEITFWDAPKATAVWRMFARTGSAPALSPGGKQMAVMTTGALLVVDASKGAVLCSIPTSRPVGEISFTADGTRVVGSTGSVVCSWDLAKGAYGGDIAVASKAGGVAPTSDGRFVLAGGKDLVDLDKKLVVWEYSGANNFASHAGKNFNIIHDGGRVVLVAATIPHEAARKAAESILPGKGLLLQPGGSVALNMTVEGPPEQQQKIAAALTEQLRRDGITVDPNSPIKLFARTEQGKTTQQTYQVRKFGDLNTTTETVSATEKITRVGYEYNGKIVWDTSASSGGYLPSMVSTRDGKTINETLQEQSKYNSTWVENARLPTFVPMPTEKPWAGGSKWTMQGVADDRAPDMPPAGLAAPKRAAAGPSAPAGNADGLE